MVIIYNMENPNWQAMYFRCITNFQKTEQAIMHLT